LDDGARAVEVLPPYRNQYVFVKEVSGANKTALRQWADNFSTARDFPRMAAWRAQKRLELNLNTYPDNEYGVFFENVVKAFSDARYTSVEKVDDFWFEKHIRAGEGGVDRMEYHFLILTNAQKREFALQVNAILADIPLEPPPSNNQIDAINRVRSSFFTDF
jgi:hypothetical protein